MTIASCISVALAEEFVKATEIIEELERQVFEFGDGDGQILDPLEPGWANTITRIEREPGSNAYRFVSDE